MSSKAPYTEHGLTGWEYEKIVELLGRKPNDLELALYGVMWSEHCSYKHSRSTLADFPTEGKQVLMGPGENAGIVDIGGGLGVVMKVESHNHPSAVEPYQGAATGVGGIIRDIFTMGARPFAGLNSLRFGRVDDERVPYLFNGVVSGIADYGNCVGIPTVGGEVYFEGAYAGNPLVNAMCLGLVEHDAVMRGRADGPGNPVLAVGASTGRDGIQGASFASEELGEDADADRPAVQVGDPFMEKLLIEATLDVIRSGAAVGIQDMGAAGLTSSSCEMASRAGTGMELDLGCIPLREEGMTPQEIMLSESQERMLLVCEEEQVETILRIYSRWDLHARVIGRVTDDGLLRLTKDKKVLAAVPASSLADDAPVYDPPAARPGYLEEMEPAPVAELSEGFTPNKALLLLLGSPNLCSRSWIYGQYDHMVRASTVVLPGSDAAVLRIRGTERGVAVTMDGNGRYCYADPRQGGKIAVSEAARNVVCAGARPLAITNCLNFGNPEDPGIFWQFKEAVAGMSEACRVFDTPVISGNVSFYNESGGKAIYPTPVVGMLGLLPDVSQFLTMGFKNPGDCVVLCGKTRGHLGASEYQRLVTGEDKPKHTPPPVDLQKEHLLHELILTANRSGMLNSAHDCADGGLAVALAECCMAGSLGAELTMPDGGSPEAVLFGEDQSRVIVSLKKDRLDEFRSLAQQIGVYTELIGCVRESCRLVIGNRIDLDLEEMSEKWSGTLPELMD